MMNPCDGVCDAGPSLRSMATTQQGMISSASKISEQVVVLLSFLGSPVHSQPAGPSPPGQPEGSLRTD